MGSSRAKLGLSKAFSFLIIVLLFTGLFTPFAWAASDETKEDVRIPLPEDAACTINEISAWDRQRLWENTLGFSADEINDLAAPDLLANEAGDFENPMRTEKAPANQELFGQTMNAQQLATLLGEDPDEVAKDLYPDYDEEEDDPEELRVDLVSAQAYAERKEKESVFTQKLRELGILPQPKDIETKKLPFEDLKIGLPDADKEIALSDLYKLSELKQEACMLVGERVQGSVSYAGLLNKDLTYASDYSPQSYTGEYENPASGKVIRTKHNQHFTSDDTTAFLNLNGGSNLLIPSFFEEWIKFVDGWNSIDLYISLFAGIGAGVSLKGTTAKVERKQKEAEALIQAEGRKLQAGTESLGRVQENRRLLGLDMLGADEATAVKKIGKIDTDFAAKVGSKEYKKAEGLAEEIIEKGGFAKEDGSFVQIVNPEVGVTRTSLTNYFESSKELAGRNRMTAETIQQELVDLRLKMRVNELLRSYAAKRVAASWFVGGAWLGPARLAYSVSERLFMRVDRTDAYIKLVVNKADIGKFRSATDFLAVGRIQELIAKWTGGGFIPEKAFKPGPVYLINKPDKSLAASDAQGSITSIDGGEGEWSVTTNWKGSSYATNFENIRGFGEKDEFSSLALETHNVLPDAVVNRKDEARTYSYITAFALPFIAARGVSNYAGNLIMLTYAMKINEWVLDIDPSEYDVPCEKEGLDTWKQLYRSAIVLGWGFNFVAPFLYQYTQLHTGIATTLATTLRVDKLFAFSKLVSNMNIPQIGQLYVGSRAMMYVTHCFDPQNKILAYQQLPSYQKEEAETIQERLEKLPSVLEQLTAGGAAKTSFAPKEEADLETMTEILNLKTALNNQRGLVYPSELYWVHIEKSAWSEKGGVFDLLKGKGCDFTENYQQEDGSVVTLSKDGVKKINPDGSTAFDFNDYWWKLRSLARRRSQELARVILPNKIISTMLGPECGTMPFLEVDFEARPYLVGSCAAADCLRESIEAVTGRQVASDLTPFFGRVSSVDTDQGTVAFTENGIRFIQLYPEDEKETAGNEITAPSPEEMASITRTELKASRLDVLGDGSVVLNGKGTDNAEIGRLKTIFFQKAKIEFDSVTGQMLVFIYVLSDVPGQNIQDITATPAKNVQADGTEADAVKLKARAKTGAEESGEQLNAALDKIQGPGGMQSFETKDKIYYFTTDEQGNPILRVINKNTGEATDYRITGPITRDAQGNLIVPTDAGPFKFGFGMQNGQPMLSAEGPDGLSEILALLAARGQDGILTFNPSTGAINVYNGQDIPLSPDFATKGIGFVGDEQGNTRGVPLDNPFSRPWSEKGYAPAGISLPAWPESLLLQGLMVLAILLGVVAVRRARWE